MPSQLPARLPNGYSALSSASVNVDRREPGRLCAAKVISAKETSDADY